MHLAAPYDKIFIFLLSMLLVLLIGIPVLIIYLPKNSEKALDSDSDYFDSLKNGGENKTGTPTPVLTELSSSSVDTTNWISYENIDNVTPFSIKYPKEWSFEEQIFDQGKGTFQIKISRFGYEFSLVFGDTWIDRCIYEDGKSSDLINMYGPHINLGTNYRELRNKNSTFRIPNFDVQNPEITSFMVCRLDEESEYENWIPGYGNLVIPQNNPTPEYIDILDEILLSLTIIEISGN